MSFCKYLPIIAIIFSIKASYASDFMFMQALGELSRHGSVQVLEQKIAELHEQSDAASSWEDPVVKIAAKNFPILSLSYDESPMTGVEVSLSQKIPLTAKYSKLVSVFDAKKSQINWQREQLVRTLQKEAWEYAITLKKSAADKNIIDDSLKWLANKIAITQKLYGNGKASQQSILELQIRKSELVILRQNINHLERQLSKKLAYLFHLDAEGLATPLEQVFLDSKAINWKILELKENVPPVDPREQSLQDDISADRFMLAAKKMAKVPDVTLSLAYTKRSDLDDKGDFVMAGISVPWPFSAKSRGDEGAAYHKLKAKELKYADFLKRKRRDLAALEIELRRIQAEHEIVQGQSLQLAQAARDITAKAYGLGQATYSELLATELKYQDLLLKKEALLAQQLRTQLAFKFLRGDRLW